MRFMLLALRFVLRNRVFHRWAWRRAGRQHECANNARAVIASPTWLAFNNCWRLGACMQVASICEVKARRVFAQTLVQIMRPCSRNTAQCCSIAAALIVAGIIPMGVRLATALARNGGLNLRSLEFPIAAARLESARRRMPCRIIALGIARFEAGARFATAGPDMAIASVYLEDAFYRSAVAQLCICCVTLCGTGLVRKLRRGSHLELGTLFEAAEPELAIARMRWDFLRGRSEVVTRSIGFVTLRGASLA